MDDSQGRKRLRSEENNSSDLKRVNNTKTPEKMTDKGSVGDNGELKDNAAASDLCEEPTLRQVFQSLNKLHDKLDNYASELHTLQNITVALDEKFQNLEETVNNHEGELSSLDTEATSMKEEIALLKKMVIKQDSNIKSLQNETLDLKTRGMKDNLLFHNLAESKISGGEDCEKLVELAVKKIGYDKPLNFARIHRLGPFIPSAKFPRPVVANLPYKQAEELLTKSRAISRGPTKAFHITRQVPQEIREKNNKMWEIAEENKAKDPKCKIRISADGKLTVNGQAIRETFQTPSARELLSLNETERIELLQTCPKLFHGETLQERGSTFRASVAEIHNRDEARQVYKAFILDADRLTAQHNIGVYRLFNNQTAKTEENYCDDGEHGAGRVIRNHLHRMNKTNIAVFVSRGTDGTHLGNKRYRLMEEAVDSALANLQGSKT